MEAEPKEKILYIYIYVCKNIKAREMFILMNWLTLL